MVLLGRFEFAKEVDPATQKALVETLRKRVTEYPTYAHLGRFYNHGAMRNNVKGIVEARPRYSGISQLNNRAGDVLYFLRARWNKIR